MMNSSNEFSSQSGYESLENAYYGSCGHQNCASRTFVTHHLRIVNDQTPLLISGSQRLRPNCIDARIFSLGVLFIGGITVGSYLLYQQDRPWPMTTAGEWLDFVSREDWGAFQLPIGRKLSSNMTFYVLLEHTATESCYNLSKCKEFVYNYQKFWKEKENIDIPFNYLIGGDGRAYEARGWSVESDHSPIHRNSSLSIAFIGNFTEIIPFDAQINTAWSLILELQFQKKISKDCHIIGISHHNRTYHDGAALFRKFSTFLFREESKWKCWDEVFTVYS